MQNHIWVIPPETTQFLATQVDGLRFLIRFGFKIKIHLDRKGALIGLKFEISEFDVPNLIQICICI